MPVCSIGRPQYAGAGGKGLGLGAGPGVGAGGQGACPGHLLNNIEMNEREQKFKSGSGYGDLATCSTSSYSDSMTSLAVDITKALSSRVQLNMNKHTTTDRLRLQIRTVSVTHAANDTLSHTLRRRAS